MPYVGASYALESNSGKKNDDVQSTIQQNRPKKGTNIRGMSR